MCRSGGGHRGHLLPPLHLLQCHPGLDPLLPRLLLPGPSPVDRLQQHVSSTAQNPCIAWDRQQHVGSTASHFCPGQAATTRRSYSTLNPCIVLDTGNNMNVSQHPAIALDRLQQQSRSHSTVPMPCTRCYNSTSHMPCTDCNNNLGTKAPHP